MARQIVIELDASGRIARIDLNMSAGECASGEGDALLERMRQFLAGHGLDLEFDQVDKKVPVQTGSEQWATASQPAFACKEVEHENRA
jgi:hypothetical protein